MNRLLMVMSLLVCFIQPVSALAGDPEIKHVPIVTLVRGIPAEIVAEVNAEPGATIVLAEVLVRVTDAGTPVRTPMSGSGNSYSATIPLSMIEGVNVFWYSINVRDNLERISSTRWIRVVVIEGAAEGGSARKAWYWGGAAALLGGGALIWENQNDDGNDGEAPVPAPPAPDNRDDDEPAAPACQGQGNASVLNTSQDCGPLPLFARPVGTLIEVYACADCVGGTLSITTSWGDSKMVSNYRNENCTTPLLLPKPSAYMAPGSGFIRVYLNGNLIKQEPFPSNDCFD